MEQSKWCTWDYNLGLPDRRPHVQWEKQRLLSRRSAGGDWCREVLTRCWKVEKSQKQHGAALGREKAKGQHPETSTRADARQPTPVLTRDAGASTVKVPPPLSTAYCYCPLLPPSPQCPHQDLLLAESKCRPAGKGVWKMSFIRRLPAPHNKRIWKSRDGTENQTTSTTTLLISWFRTQLWAN